MRFLNVAVPSSLMVPSRLVVGVIYLLEERKGTIGPLSIRLTPAEAL